MVPERICSLSLISTAAQIENTTSFVENLRTRINMFLTKITRQVRLRRSAHALLNAWLDSPDDTQVPDASTPNVELPPSGKYGKFETNYQRFAAQELTKRLDPDGFPRKGFMMQAIAAGWHYKSAKQLEQLGDKVGRERIMVLHGTRDNMITVPHGRKLIEMIKPGVGAIKEGYGHVFMLEDAKWHNEMVESLVQKSEKLNEGKK